MSDGFWTVLVDEALCAGRFEKHADAKRAAAALTNRPWSRPHPMHARPIRLHLNFTSLPTETSTR